MSVVAGADSDLQTPYGLRIDVPATSLTGKGRLEVHRTTSASGVKGYAIRLTGSAKLVGKATLSFTHNISQREPDPLVGYKESASAPITLERDVKLTPTGATVTTTHFSNWFIDWWGGVLNEVTNQVKKTLGSDTSGEQPTCTGTDAAKAAGVVATSTLNGVTVTSTSSAAAKWCVGQTASGQTEVKVTNTANYPVTLEASPDLVLENQDTSLTSLFPQLLSSMIDDVSTKGDSLQLMTSGETYDFLDLTEVPQAITLRPSAAGLSVSVIDYAAETMEQIADFLPTKTTDEKAGQVALKGLAAAQCVVGVHQMDSAKVTTARDALAYLQSATTTVFGCLGDAINEAYGVNGVLVGLLVSGTSWIADGIKIILSEGEGAWSTVFQSGGYVVDIGNPAPNANNPQYWTIDSTGVGPFKFGMSWAQVASILAGNPDDAGPEPRDCQVMPVTEKYFNVWLDAKGSSPIALNYMSVEDKGGTVNPETENGITIGSTFDEVLKAFPGSVVSSDDFGYHYIATKFPDGMPIVFDDATVNTGTVREITIGRTATEPPWDLCGAGPEGGELAYAQSHG